MPFCEFQLKAIAYRRMNEDAWRRARLVAYSARIGAHLDPKKLPKSEREFMPIGNDIDERARMKEAVKQRMQEYRKNKEK